MSSEVKHTVLVTGGSGYLAGWTIIRLLNDGHHVRTTLRDASRGPQVAAKLGRHAPTTNLSFHQADLLADAGWTQAASGADRLLHIASPMPVREYREHDLVPAAREGTRRAMKAAVDAGIKHLVVTSSLAAASPTRDGASDETFWTDTKSPTVSNYALAKTLAERDAWSLAKQRRDELSLTTILPSMVMGPILGSDTSGSMQIPLQLISGKLPALPRVALSPVHVGDVADLHVRAMTDPAAIGKRLILATPPTWFSELAGELREDLGAKGKKISERRAPDWILRFAAKFSADARLVVPELGLRRTFDTSKAEAILGRPLRPARQALLEAARSLIEAGLA